MKNEKFEQARQAVAKKHWFENWEYGIFVSDHETVKTLYQEAAEWMCNEAVKSVINDVIGQADDIIAWVDQYPKRLEEQYYSSGKVNASEIIKKFCRDRPLPFPQQPDER